MPSSFIKVFRRLAIIDVTRFRGLLVAVVGCAAVFLAMHFVLGRALGKNAAALFPRQRLLGPALYAKIWSRVAAIDRLHRHGQLPHHTRLGLYLGVSTTAAGIQRRDLERRAEVADRWMVLSGAGLSFENLESVMHPIFFCSLKPSVVVLGIHPQMLVGEPYLGDEPTIGPPQVVGRRRRALEAHIAGFRALSIVRQHWIVKNHAMVEQFLRGYIYAFRLWAMYLAGVTAEDLCPPAAAPWDEEPLDLWNLDDLENQFAQAQLNFWSRRGHFQAENYKSDGDQARSLIRMIRAYRALGAKVYIVLMPLRSTLLKHVPPSAKPCLLQTLQVAFPEAPPPVIDLETAIEDKYFRDEAHLSKSGAARLSRLVAKRLQAEK